MKIQHLALWAIALIISAAAAMPVAAKGDTKEEVLKKLSSAYLKDFESPDSFTKSLDFKTWDRALSDARDFVTGSQNDALLTKSLGSLLSANEILVKATIGLVNQKPDFSRFKEVETNAGTIRTALKEETFVLPSKRSARDVLLQIGEHLNSASRSGQAQIIIADRIEQLSILREINRLARQMEATRLQAKTIENSPELKKQFEDQIRKRSDEAQQSVASIRKNWLDKRNSSLVKLKAKQALKVDELALIQSDIAVIDASLSDLNAFIATLTPEQAPLIFMLFMASGDALKVAEDKVNAANAKMAKIRKQVLTMQEGIAKIDLLLKGEIDDPRFAADGAKAIKAAQDASDDLKNVDELFAQKTKEALNKVSDDSAKLLSSFDEKVKQVKCPDLKGLNTLKSGVEKCRSAAIASIKKASEVTKRLQACAISNSSDDPAIEKCANVVRTSYLKLTTAG